MTIGMILKNNFFCASPIHYRLGFILRGIVSIFNGFPGFIIQFHGMSHFRSTEHAAGRTFRSIIIDLFCMTIGIVLINYLAYTGFICCWCEVILGGIEIFPAYIAVFIKLPYHFMHIFISPDAPLVIQGIIGVTADFACPGIIFNMSMMNTVSIRYRLLFFIKEILICQFPV